MKMDDSGAANDVQVHVQQRDVKRERRRFATKSFAG